MVRQEGWEIKFSRFLAQRRKTSFAWGTNDCLMMAADGVRSITDFDPAAQWRGYTTEAEALALLAANGGVSGLISQGLGFEPNATQSLAKRGDVVMMELPTGETAGLVDDSGMWIVSALSDKNTLVRFPLSYALKIWSY